MATEPRWLDETEMAAWHSLVVAGMHMFAALDRDLRDAFDVTLLGHGILLMLRNNSEGLTMGHRASQFGTEASVITKAGERLCDRMGPVHVESVRANFLDHVPRKDLPALGGPQQRRCPAVGRGRNGAGLVQGNRNPSVSGAVDAHIIGSREGRSVAREDAHVAEHGPFALRQLAV
jgi:hypothetical protein